MWPYSNRKKTGCTASSQSGTAPSSGIRKGLPLPTGSPLDRIRTSNNERRTPEDGGVITERIVHYCCRVLISTPYTHPIQQGPKVNIITLNPCSAMWQKLSGLLVLTVATVFSSLPPVSQAIAVATPSSVEATNTLIVSLLQQSHRQSKTTQYRVSSSLARRCSKPAGTTATAITT